MYLNVNLCLETLDRGVLGETQFIEDQIISYHSVIKGNLCWCLMIVVHKYTTYSSIYTGVGIMANTL